MEAAEAAFVAAHPGFEATRVLDVLRRRELRHLDAEGCVYLDHAGSGLYLASQVRRHSKLLLGHVLGNPHSSHAASATSMRLVERCRRRVLEHFRAGGEEYAVVFTANASQALKLVGEAYPFGPGDELLLTVDNHNSVNGLRELARVRGARTRYVPSDPPDLRVDEGSIGSFLDGAGHARRKLFAYPAQSNFSGVQHPLEWVPRARSRGWTVLLDAAAFVPSNRLDLSRVKPDFVALSFYKMFGYPTGVGALIARRESLGALRRPWFSGGTVDAASVGADRFVRAPGEAGFEDGTVDFTGIPAVEVGLDLVESIGVERIHERVRFLTGWLLDELRGLEHPNGRSAVRLYGPAGTERRGGTIAFNVQDAGGRLIDHLEIEAAAARRRIALRTGCFCNPGAAEQALGTPRGALERCFDLGGDRMTREDLRRCLAPRPSGAVRVSLGAFSNFADVFASRELVRELLEPRPSRLQELPQLLPREPLQ